MNPIIFQFILGFIILGVGCLLVLHEMFSPAWTRTTKDFYKKKLWGGLGCALLGALIMMAPIFPFVFD